MKKQRKLIIVLMILSIIVFIAAGVVNAANMGGYVTAKEAAKSTVQLKNATMKTASDVYIDGEKVEDGSSNTTTIKADIDNKLYSSVIEYPDQPAITNSKVAVNGSETSYTVPSKSESYQTADKNIYSVYMDDTNIPQYQIMEQPFTVKNLFDMPKEQVRIYEILLDTFSGSAKDYVSTESVDNQKKISANINNEQLDDTINELVNLIAVSYVGYAAYDSNNPGYVKDPTNTKMEDFMNKMANGYISNCSISNIKVNADVNDQNYITKANIEITFEYTDKAGVKTSLKYVTTFEITDIGTTKVELPELNDKNTVDITSPSDDAYNKFYEDPNAQNFLNGYYELQDKIINNYYNMTDSQKADVQNKINEIKGIIDNAKNQ